MDCDEMVCSFVKFGQLRRTLPNGGCCEPPMKESSSVAVATGTDLQMQGRVGPAMPGTRRTTWDLFAGASAVFSRRLPRRYSVNSNGHRKPTKGPATADSSS